MSDLSQVLSSLRVRIAASRGKRAMNEQNTKATLVEPILRALGWDTEDIDEVVHEYKRRPSDDPVDYALLSQRAPRLFIEAKAFGESLAGHRWAKQILGYASVAGVEWIVLTNGDEWRIYNAHASVAVEEKLFRTVQVSAEDGLAQETLALLAKDQWNPKQIEIMWQIQHVDRRVKVAIEELFGASADGGLVNAIRRRSQRLSPKEIKASLGRVLITLDFPQVMGPPVKPGTPARPAKGATKKPPTETSGISQHDLIKAGIIKAPLALERTYKGHTARATLKLNGKVMHAGEAFDSLSAAGGRARQTISGSTHPLATNGWGFWCYKDQNGKLVPVGALRQRYLEMKKKR